MQTTTQQPLNSKWTRLIEKDGKTIRYKWVNSIA